MIGDKQDSQSFEAVYETNFPVLIRVAFHITGSMDTAEELVQEAFIRYYNRGEKLPDMNQTKYWLIRVVKNLCYNSEKKKTRERKAYERVKNEPKPEVETGEVAVMKEETLKIVQKALEVLPYKLRSVLVLKEYADLSYKEIAHILKITEGNVKVRVHRARLLLQQTMDKEDVYVS